MNAQPATTTCAVARGADGVPIAPAMLRTSRPVRTLRAIGKMLLPIVLTACGSSSERAVDPVTYGLGHTPSAATLAALDIDVDLRGRGLPPGQGTAAEGAILYARQCAACHGAKGEGVRPAPKLVGRTPAAGHAFANDGQADRTIGNYWPYATTVYDYVKRAMPLNTPGTLTPDQTYSLVAYLLSENGIIAATATMNAQTLPAVQMPARAFFVNDNRTGGPGFR
jgi:mono/diheme cytochrome c family protein